MLRLGPFLLEQQLGAGANGQVWRAIHEPSGVPVAVKIMTSRAARRPEVQSQLENEVRSVAALDHPNIVMLLDQGRIDPPGTEDFPAESPYLVMELASGGTLERIKALTRYEDLRAILLALLDALAHAHARGVVHRDLTPRNILIAKKEDLRPGFKVADFGIALPLERAPDPAREDAVIGTLAYMAPEQLRARWRDYGPWTDLFSLGLVAQRLATGRPPYPEGKPSEMFEARLMGKRAALDPLFALPLGFPNWLDRMLADEPAHRFQRAADAAYALAELGAPEVFGDFEDEAASTIRTAIEQSRARTMSIAEEAPTDPRPTADRPPPLPNSWRHPRPSPPPIRLVGAGRGLFRVRAHPFVDRESERDAIWQELKQVWSDGRARLIVLSGKAGVGRSRLAEWSAQRAHEVGACTILRATFRDIPSSGDGLGPMLERTFRSEGLDHSETIAHVRRRLSWYGIADEVLARALTRLMRPPIAIDDDAPSGLSPIADRYELLRRFMARIGGIRPVLIWLDDAHFGADALSFVDHVLSAPQETPVLFVATMSEEVLQDRLIEAAILESLFRDPRTKKIALGPLDDDSHRELIERLLPFTKEAAEHLAERTMGNPLLAMELVSEWVDRGVLTSSATGFRITPGVRPSVPSGVHEVYLEQLGRILSDRPKWWAALEIAAVIGMEIDQNEWALACEAANLGVDADSRTELMRRLFRASMARPTARGFVWAQARLRRVLVERAGDEGRLADLHAAAASATQASAEGLPVAAERLAFHLQQAGRGREATTPLLSAARSLLEASDLVGARAILDRRDALLETERVPSTDHEWGAGWVLRAEVLLHLGNLAEADEIAAKGMEMGKRLRWRSVVPASTFVRAKIATMQGSLDEARELLDRAAKMYAAENNPAGEAACLRELGYVDLNLGELDEAEEKLEQAQRGFEIAGDTIGLGYTHGHLGLLERRRRNYEASSAHYERALELFREKDNRYGVALALNGLGDSLRYAGAIAEAESCYREAEHAYESIAAMVSAATPRLNLALLALERSDYEGALRLAELARPPLEKADKKSNLAVAHALSLPRLAAIRDWDEFDDRMDLIERLIATTRFADADLAWTLEVASELCLRASEDRRAQRTLRGATAQLEALRRIR